MRILVTGCEGMLGRAVMALWPEQADPEATQAVGVDLADGDLTDPQASAALIERHEPDWIVNCAAWTDVDGAESSRAEAMAANATATGHLARLCDQRRIGLTHISTDYVFNGRAGTGYVENGVREPVNYYGQTKAGGEEQVECMTAPWQIVRTSWLFGDGKVNFVKTMRRLLGERETLRVVADQTGCPTYADDLAAVLAFLVQGEHTGVYHATNRGATTWFALAQEVARCLNLDPLRITACPTSEYPTPAVRPANSVLLSRHLEEVGCPARPTWQDAVVRYVDRLEKGDVVFP